MPAPAALGQLLLCEGRVVVAAQRGVDGVVGVPGLQPHLGRARLGGEVVRVAPGAAGGLHEQGEQALGRAEVAGEQRSVGLYGRHQRDAAEVVPLGHHLRAHEHVHLARVHLGQLLLQRALGALGVDLRGGLVGGVAERMLVGAHDVGLALNAHVPSRIMLLMNGDRLIRAGARCHPQS